MCRDNTLLITEGLNLSNVYVTVRLRRHLPRVFSEITIFINDLMLSLNSYVIELGECSASFIQ